MTELRFLGSVELKGSDGGSILSVLSQPKRASLLAFLACARPRGFHRRDRLLALFWPEADDEHARASLRQSLHFLRRSLGEGAISARGDDEVGLDPDRVWSDVAAFDLAVAERDLARAMELYRGDFLSGFHLPEAPEFERWADVERKRLNDQMVKVASELRDQEATVGNFGAAVLLARRIVDAAPGNEAAARGLIELLAASGDRASAIGAFEAFSRRLAEEFDLTPSAALAEFVAAFRGGVPSSGSRAEASPPHRGIAAPGGIPAAPRAEFPSDARTAAPSASPGRSNRWGVIVGAMAAVAIGIGLFVGGGGGAGPEDEFGVMVSFLDYPSADSTLQRLAEEFTEEITGAVGGLERFSTLDRRLSSRVGESGSDPTQVAADMGLDYVVAGRVRWVGSDARVSVYMSDARSGREMWSNNYSLSAPEDPAAWREIGVLVAQAVDAVVPDTRKPIGREATATEIAHAEGIAEFSQRDPSRFADALGWFDRAIDLDPDNAPAHASKAAVLILMGAYEYGMAPPRGVIPDAMAAARKAIQLEPGLADAWAALGLAQLSYEWNPAAADSSFLRAVELDPGLAAAHHWRGLLLLALGDTDATLEIAEALRLEQRGGPSSPLVQSAWGRHWYYLGQYDRSIAEYQEALARDESFLPARLGIGIALAMSGRYEEAREEYRMAGQIIGNPFAPLLLALNGHSVGRSGDRVGAERALASLELPLFPWIPSEYRAIVHVGAGELDQAVEELWEAYRERSAAMPFLHVDPILEPLRPLPAFQALIDSVGVRP